MRALAIAVLLAAAIFVVPGCSRGCRGGSGPGERTRVSVSIFPVYDLVRRVAGPDADVSLVLPPGHTEHSFAPTPRDVESVAGAKLDVMVGLGLDPWMEKLVEDAVAGPHRADPRRRAMKVGDRVPTLTVEQAPRGDEDARADDRGATDPHVWLDPERARLIVRAVAEELGRVDSPHALAYRRRATELDQSIAALDQELEARTRALETRGLVTFHGSFQYFAERYKLSILAVIEPLPGAEPSREHLEKVLAVVKARNVPALFSEPQLDPRPAKVLADEARLPLGVLDPVGGSSETDSYEKLLRYDMAQLEKHLRK